MSNINQAIAMREAVLSVFPDAKAKLPLELKLLQQDPTGAQAAKVIVTALYTILGCGERAAQVMEEVVTESENTPPLGHYFFPDTPDERLFAPGSDVDFIYMGVSLFDNLQFHGDPATAEDRAILKGAIELFLSGVSEGMRAVTDASAWETTIAEFSAALDELQSEIVTALEALPPDQLAALEERCRRASNDAAWDEFEAHSVAHNRATAAQKDGITARKMEGAS